MNVTRVIAAAAMAIGLIGAQASAKADTYNGAIEKRWYITGFAGWADLNDRKFDFADLATGARARYDASVDDGYVLGGAVGMVVNPNFRVELELARVQGVHYNGYAALAGGGIDAPAGGSRLTTLMMNTWFNANYGNLKPYIGGGVGIGWARSTLETANFGPLYSGRDSGIVGQLGAGVRYTVNEKWDLDLGYRLRVMPDVTFASRVPGFATSAESIRSQAIQVGVSYRF